jgi:chromate reductase, NAD(P)H dehydrogenase (quinone)
MDDRPKILALAGSLRKGSFNKKLIKIAAKNAEQAGAEVTLIDLKDFPLPIYDGDIEEQQGLPPNALKIKELMWKHDGFIISAPEYNSSISGVLKNTIDWASRPATSDEVYLSCFIDKIALLMSTSPSNLGGLRGLVHLRAILENIHTFVLPGQKTIPNASEAFDSEDNLKNVEQKQSIERLAIKLVKTIRKLKQ